MTFNLLLILHLVIIIIIWFLFQILNMLVFAKGEKGAFSRSVKLHEEDESRGGINGVMSSSGSGGDDFSLNCAYNFKAF